MANHAPRILVGCPTHVLKTDSLDAYVKGIEGLTYPHYDVMIEDNSPTEEYAELIHQKFETWKKNNPEKKLIITHTENPPEHARERLVNGRNLIRDYFLKNEYTHFLSLEQDIVPPRDVIERLLAREKDICSGVYLNQQTKEDGKHLVVMAGTDAANNANEDAVQSLGFMNLFPARIMEIAYCGVGCILISKNALEKIKFRVDLEKRASDDIYFARDAKASGFTLYLDTSMLCAHHFNDAFKKTKY